MLQASKHARTHARKQASKNMSRGADMSRQTVMEERASAMALESFNGAKCCLEAAVYNARPKYSREVQEGKDLTRNSKI